MTNYVMTIKKLQRAINMVSETEKILYSTSQFYRDDVKHAITMFLVKVSIPTPEGRTNQQIYKSASQVRILLYFKDIYELVSAGNSIMESADEAERRQANYVTAKQMERRHN